MKVICQTCKVETNHEVVADFKDGSEPNDEFWWKKTYQIIRCAGCETVSFRLEAASDANINPFENELIPDETLYPSRTEGREPLQLHFLYLPQKINQVYTEVIGALNNSLPVLAGIGLRTLIEAICNDQRMTGKDLQTKIDNLAAAGIIGNKQCEMLHSLRFLGNFAAHEAEKGDASELAIAYNIAESMINTLYILPVLNASITTGKPVAANSLESTSPKNLF